MLSLRAVWNLSGSFVDWPTSWQTKRNELTMPIENMSRTPPDARQRRWMDRADLWLYSLSAQRGQGWARHSARGVDAERGQAAWPRTTQRTLQDQSMTLTHPVPTQDCKLMSLLLRLLLLLSLLLQLLSPLLRPTRRPTQIKPWPRHALRSHQFR